MNTRIWMALPLLAALALMASHECEGGRGGRGGGGARGGGGGARMGGGGGISRPAAPARPISPSTGAPRAGTLPSGGGVLHGGGVGDRVGSGGGDRTWTGPGGGSISSDYGGKVITLPGGGKGVVGGKDSTITTPGGKTIGVDSGGIIGKGAEGGAIGPGGKGVAGGKGFAAGDMGMAGSSRTAARGARGTAHVSRSALVTQRGNVYRNFAHYDCFGPGWWGRYPNAWRAAAWTTAGLVWRACAWGTCYDYCGLPAEPVYYDYGSNIVYEGDDVYVNGEVQGTVDEYAASAAATAAAGQAATASEKEDWLPLGVFAMVQGEDTNANILFQLAVNKAGVIRGNYYNGLEDNTLPVYGSVDKKYRTAAWTVGDKKTPVYEAGIANLTKEATTMMVHFGPGRSQQWNLIRMEQPEETKK